MGAHSLGGHDSREVYRQLLRSPILRDMISTARLYPSARAMIVKLDQVPPPLEGKPSSAHVFTASLTMHRFLITSQELPYQVPPNAVDIKVGVTDYWTKANSDLAFLTMFNEARTIEGGRSAKTDEYGSERLYGPKRYPKTLRMLSKEVDDVLFGKLPPLDVLVSRAPHCSMPAPEAVQSLLPTCVTRKWPQHTSRLPYRSERHKG